MLGAPDAFAGLNVRAGERLVRGHAAVQRLLDAETPNARAEALAALRAATATWFVELAAQLEREKQELYAIADKLVPLRVQRQLLRDMWEPHAWAALLPWALKQLPTNDRRLRLLRALQWALPERMQQVGLYVARGVDAVLWAGLTRDMPAIIPRGMPGWRMEL